MSHAARPLVEARSTPAFIWEGLVPHTFHPVKVQIIEAWAWIGVNPAPAELNRLLDGPGVSHVVYHVNSLKDLGVHGQMFDGGPPFSWEALVPTVIHPIKVAIVEAMAWIEIPLSPRDIDRLLDESYGVSLMAYHMRRLLEMGALRRAGHRQVRGALQNLFVLQNQDLVGCG